MAGKKRQRIAQLNSTAALLRAPIREHAMTGGENYRRERQRQRPKDNPAEQEKRRRNERRRYRPKQPASAKANRPLPSPFPAAFPAALPHFYALFPPPCISYHTKAQIYDDILCPASFFCGGAADRRPSTADRKKALPFREAPFGTIQLHQPGGQVMSRPAST